MVGVYYGFQDIYLFRLFILKNIVQTVFQTDRLVSGQVFFQTVQILYYDTSFVFEIVQIPFAFSEIRALQTISISISQLDFLVWNLVTGDSTSGFHFYFDIWPIFAGRGFATHFISIWLVNAICSCGTLWFTDNNYNH